MRSFFYGISFIIWAVSLNGQSAVSQNFTIVNGLPSNRVYFSIIDAQGFLWFSTDKGVSRYDGYAFKNFTTRDGLTDNEVFYMFQDSKMRIWFMTYNGKLSYFKEGKFYNPSNTPFLRQANSQGMFSRAYEDKWGTLVFITSNNGMYLLRDSTFTHCLKNKAFFLPYTYHGEIYFSANSTDTSILCKIDKKGHWQNLDTTYEKYFLFNNWAKNDSVYNVVINKKREGGWIIYSRPKNKYTFNKTIINIPKNTTLLFSKNINGSIYLGTNNGLYTIDTDKKTLISKGYTTAHISSVIFDFEGNMWITTLQKGVFLQPKINLKKYRNITGNISGLAINPYNNNIWAGSPQKLYKITDKGKTIFSISKTLGYDEKITAFYFIDKESLIIGSEMVFAYYKNNTIKLITNDFGVKNFSLNPYNKKLMAAISSKTVELSINKKIPQIPKKIITGRSTAILALKEHILLMGSNNGLYKVNTLTGKKKLILNTRINQIKKDSSGNIWCSSDVNGLYLYKNEKFRQFTEKEGLHSNNINKLVIDGRQNIWLTSPFGIVKAKYKNNKLNIENFILSNILGREQVNNIAIKDDTILVATTAGLYYFKENRLKKDTITPPLVIIAILVEGKNQKISDNYTFSHEQNNIHINFTGISYSTKNINYRYVLAPKGKEWQYISTRSINLVDLNPGKYVLTLQAIKNGTIYSETKQITFTIIPPFYKTWWFYALLLLAIVASTLLIIRYRINRIRKRAYISQAISESKQKALRAQMNPHFLFNSLISIQSFFLNKRNTEGQEYTSKFSKLIRDILDNSDKEFVSIEDEVATLKNYTDLENIRLQVPFIFTVTINEKIDPHNTEIPTMLLQPIIENAIWHGINYLQNQQGKIVVHFTLESGNLKITVDDNGVGFSKSAELNRKRNHVSKGTKLIKERLEAINLNRKTTVSYSAIDKPSGGAKVTLIIPLEK